MNFLKALFNRKKKTNVSVTAVKKEAENIYKSQVQKAKIAKKKERFSEKVQEVLMHSGWYEGRKIDVTEQLRCYEESGFETFDILPKFLKEFDNLYFPTYSTFESNKRHELKGEACELDRYNYFDAKKSMQFNSPRYDKPSDQCKAIADALKEKCVPIGQNQYKNTIFLTESGKIYEQGASLRRLGVTIDEGVSCIINGMSNICELSIINQDLDILSNDEIISNGEYSEDEPDIKDFEVNTINSGKTNHIMYSKYSNGNIKHYYQITSKKKQDVIEYQYVYKVTYYRSGKLKAYNQTKVNERNIKAYEWYEHGEIKSMIEYYRNERITYKNYAANGAFIEEKNKLIKYSNSDFYNKVDNSPKRIIKIYDTSENTDVKKLAEDLVNSLNKKLEQDTAVKAKKITDTPRAKIAPKEHKYAIAITDTPNIEDLSAESKKRFSKKVLEMLMRAGWYEGRKIDITEQLKYYQECGFEIFDIIPKFLEEFDQLYFKKYDVFQIEKRYELREEDYKPRAYTCFDSKKPRFFTQYEYHTGIEQCQAISTLVKERCVPIGKDNVNNTIFLTESGKIYSKGYFLKRLGVTIEEGIQALIDSDYHSCELRVLNQELDILSDDEIISKGKYYGYEPDIKDFELTVINLGKKNYIIYSKYSNGNIKHYYRYQTYVQRFTEYKYVYKVTYYESGKLKDYTETKVNNTDMKTYEWYEHGEIKSIIDYHNNSIICKNYAENGAFLGRKSKREQYITNNVYLQREAKKKPKILSDYVSKSQIIPKGHKYAINETPDVNSLSAKNKNRFPKEVLEMLMRVGWYEGRKIDVTEQLKRYEQCGFEIFDILPKFLEEFDKLYLCEYRKFNEYRKCVLKDEYCPYSPTRDYFDAEKAMYIDKARFDTPEKIKTIANSARYTPVAEAIKERFVPIGQAYMDLYLTESGKMYMDIGTMIRIGSTIEEGIIHLIYPPRNR